MANNKAVDKTKSSNVKCEHCEYWHNVAAKGEKYVCQNPNSKKYKELTNYWNRCKSFEWKKEPWVKCCENCDKMAFCIYTPVFPDEFIAETTCIDWSGWVDAEAQSPKEDGKYLVYINYPSIEFGEFKNGKWMVEGVLYWRPLPDCPEDKE